MRYLIILTSLVSWFSVGLSAALGAAEPEPVLVYVSLAGDDNAPGTVERPVATLERALVLADKQPSPAEIVIRGGTYFLERTVTIPRGRDSRLVIRAAEREKVVFDGSIPVRQAEPIAGYPGVYAIRGNFPGDDPPNAWDTETGRYFIGLADLAAVARVDSASVVLDSGTMAVHCRDGMSPVDAAIRMSRAGVMYGFYVYRSNVTLRNLEFHNFISRSAAAGVIIGPGLTGSGRQRQGNFAANTVIDSCRAVNCYFGFRVYTGGLNSLFTHSRVENCITGIWVSGVDTVVEHCEMVNDPDWYERAPDSATYERAGIRFYHQPEDAVVRYNLIVNFRTSFSSKSSPGRYLFENNTIVNGNVAAVPDWGFVMRRNIFAGFPVPFQSDGNRHREAKCDHCVFWGPRDFAAIVMDRALGGGPGNVFADPLFAAPHLGDYRLLPGSPALGIEDGLDAGAFPAVPPDFHAPPRLRVSVGPRRGDEVELGFAVEASAPVIRTACRAAGSALWEEREFAAADTFGLADPEGDNRFHLRVMDETGVWSAEVSTLVRAPPRPATLVGAPEVIASRLGALFLVVADGDLDAAVEYQDGKEWVAAGASSYTRGRPAPLFLPGLEVGRTYPWRVSAAGKIHEGQLTVAGPSRVTYVSREGEDTAAAGSRESPYRTLQYALDRVMPGDRVRVLPGVYFGEHRLSGRGGTAENPVIIEGLYPNTVIFDGLRRVSTILHLENAPHVLVRNLSFRWFNGCGIAAAGCEALRVSRCRFHNQYWRSSAPVLGRALIVNRCPEFMVDHCIFSRNRYGIEVNNSPGARVLHNTAVAGAVSHFLWRGEPVEGVVVKYNSFNWNGNQLVDIRHPLEVIREKCVFDFNNYAMAFRQAPGTEARRGVYGPSVKRPFAYLPTNREFWRVDMPGHAAFALFNMADWVAFSGQDRNSIFADPKWIDPRAGRFDVAADSPNILPDGTVIGALGYLGEDPNMAPEVVLVSPWHGLASAGPVDFEAHASDYDGRVVKVAFYAGNRRLGEVAGPRWRLAGISLPAGRHAISARATDDRGAVTASEAAIVRVE